MRLDATIPATTLISLIQHCLPLRIDLGSAAEPGRLLTLADPSDVLWVAAQGLRVSCRAEIVWPVLGIKVPVAIRSITLLLQPLLAERDAGKRLVFRLTIEEADVVGVPAALDSKLREWVNQALMNQDVELGWGVQETFTRTIELPTMLASLRSLELAVDQVLLEVAEEALRLSVVLAPSLTRTAASAP